MAALPSPSIMEGVRKNIIMQIYENLNSKEYSEKPNMGKRILQTEHIGSYIYKENPDDLYKLQTNSLLIQNFKIKQKCYISKPQYMNETNIYSDHPILDCTFEGIHFRTHNLLRYGDLFKLFIDGRQSTYNMDIYGIPKSSQEEMTTYIKKKQFQYETHHKFLGLGNVLALQECDYEFYHNLITQLDETKYFHIFIPRTIKIMQRLDDMKINNFKERCPNPFCNSFGNVLIINKEKFGGPYITNKDHNPTYTIYKETKLIKGIQTDINDVYAYNTRDVYILCPKINIGFISCHHSHETLTIHETIKIILELYPNMKLYLMGDFNRNISELMGDIVSKLSYQTIKYKIIHVLNEPIKNRDHILMIEKDNSSSLSAKAKSFTPMKPPTQSTNSKLLESKNNGQRNKANITHKSNKRHLGGTFYKTRKNNNLY